MKNIKSAFDNDPFDHKNELSESVLDEIIYEIETDRLLVACEIELEHLQVWLGSWEYYWNGQHPWDIPPRRR